MLSPAPTSSKTRGSLQETRLERKAWNVSRAISSRGGRVVWNSTKFLSRTSGVISGSGSEGDWIGMGGGLLAIKSLNPATKELRIVGLRPSSITGVKIGSW